MHLAEKSIRGLATLFALFGFLGLGFAQMPTARSETDPFLELNYRVNLDDLYLTSVKVYPDGRYIRDEEYPEESPSGKYRRVHQTEELRLEASEIAVLMTLLESDEFRSASDKYILKMVIDNGRSVRLAYRGKLGSKVTSLYNFYPDDPESRAKVPSSIVKLVIWGRFRRFE